MSRLRFGPTAALPRLGSTSSVKVKRINSNMSRNPCSEWSSRCWIRLGCSSLSWRKNSGLTSFFIEPRAGDPVASLSKRSISAGSIVALWSPTGTISAPNHFMTTIQTEGRPRLHQGLQESSEHGPTQLSSILANQFRLLLHALAYQPPARLSARDSRHKLEIETTSSCPQDRGPRQTTRRIWVHLSSAFPEQPLFHLVLSRLSS